MTKPPSNPEQLTTQPSDPSDVVLSVQHLSKTFALGFFRKRIEAVKNVSFDVKKGEVFGLVGPNGAGKTTTIKMLLGLIKPSTGNAWILGHPTTSLESRKRVGYLPEISYYYDYLTPEEILDFYGRLYGLDARLRKTRVEELLVLVGLEKAKGKPLRKFSKGMMQRVGLAQAMLSDPEIVILDEPQSGLDPIGRKDVADLIVSLKTRGKTVFFSSHILPDVERICDRVAVMVNGHVVDVGPLGQLLNPKRLQTEIEIAGPLPNALLQEFQNIFNGLRIVPHDSNTTIILPGDQDSQAILKRCLTENIRVERILPRHESLEDVFVREAKLGQPT